MSNPESPTPIPQATPERRGQKISGVWPRPGAQFLEQDEYDRFSKKWNTTVGFTTLGMLAALGTFQQFTDSKQLQFMETFFNEWGMGMSLAGYGAKIPYEWYKGRKKVNEENSRGLLERYNSFGRVVYKGNEPLEVGNVTLKKGDNVFCVALSTIRNKDGSDLTPVQQQAVSEYYLQELQAIKGIFPYYAKNRPYKAAAVSFPQLPPQLERKTPEAARVNQDTLLRGKNIVPRDTDAKVVFLNPEDLEVLTKTSFSILKEAVEALESETATLLFEKAQKADTTEERKKAADELQAHVYSLLARNLVATQSGPDASFGRVDHNPLRRKIYNSAQLRTYFLKNMEGNVRPEVYVQFTEENKPVRQQKVDDFLGITEATLDEILQQDNADGLRRGKLSYKIWDLLRTDDMSLFEDKPLSGEDILERLGDVDIIPPRRYPLMDKAKTSKRKFKSLNNWITPILLAGVLSAGAGIVKPKVEEIVAGNITSIPKVLRDLGPRFNQGDRYDNFEHNSLVFPSEVPQNIPEWGMNYVNAKNEVDIFSEESKKERSGYFIATTSNKRDSKGSWVPVTDRNHELHLPQQVPSGTPYLELEKWVHFGSLEKSKSIKIPLKAGRKLGAIEVQGITSDKGVNANKYDAINFKVYELVDGTIELEVPRGLTSSVIGFYVQAREVTASPGEGVRATKPIEPIDVSKLSPQAQEYVRKAEEFSSNQNISLEEALQFIIAHEFKYSIHPPNARAIESAKTPIDQVNAISAGESCDCDVCNTLAIDLASTRPHNDNFTNMAFGYMRGTYSNGSAPNTDVVAWLLSSASHGFQVDQKGKIIDATAQQSADDQFTKDYLKSLENSDTIEGSVIIDRFYNEIERNFANARDKKYIVALGLILSGGAGIFLLKGGKKMIDRYGNHETFRELGDQAILKLYSSEDLSYAYQIFSEVSWRESGKAEPVAVDGIPTDPQELLVRLRENINFEQVADYLAKDTEAIDYDSFKLRVLGNYLINS